MFATSESTSTTRDPLVTNHYIDASEKHLRLPERFRLYISCTDYYLSGLWKYKYHVTDSICHIISYSTSGTNICSFSLLINSSNCFLCNNFMHIKSTIHDAMRVPASDPTDATPIPAPKREQGQGWWVRALDWGAVSATEWNRVLENASNCSTIHIPIDDDTIMCYLSVGQRVNGTGHGRAVQQVDGGLRAHTGCDLLIGRGSGGRHTAASHLYGALMMELWTWWVCYKTAIPLTH